MGPKKKIVINGVTCIDPYKWPKIYMGNWGYFNHPYKWSYGPLLITGDGAHFVPLMALLKGLFVY